MSGIISWGLDIWRNNAHLTSIDGLGETYNSWTSPEEWKNWYNNSTLQSALNATKDAAVVGKEFVTTLVQPPLKMVSKIRSV